jgi:hypothetical protein
MLVDVMDLSADDILKRLFAFYSSKWNFGTTFAVLQQNGKTIL